MSKTFLTWATPGALLAAMLLAGCGGGGGGGGGGGSSPTNTGGTVTTGGGGSTTGGGGGTTTGALTLTAAAPATPGHGYIALTLPASTAATYTLQRAPVTNGVTGSFTTVATGLAGGTTYDDHPAGGTTDPAIGSSYAYEVSSSAGQTSAATPPVSPVGPAASFYFGSPSASLPYTSAPFAQSTSGINFQYRVNTSGVPSVVMTVTTDSSAALTLSDIKSVTIDGNSANPNTNFYTPSQLGAALTVSGNVITLNTANLPANSGVTVPVVPAGGLLTLNFYVATAHGNGSYVVFQGTQQMPASGATTSTVAGDTRFTYNLSNHL